jgi:hypothetical protein
MTKRLHGMSFIRMDAGRRDQTFPLMRAFLRRDEHYLDSSRMASPASIRQRISTTPRRGVSTRSWDL